jgi:MFS family permease
MSGGLGRSFWLLFIGESASALGTAASVIALPVTALQATGDVRDAGLCGTALSVGILTTRLPAGVIADRFDRRTVVLLCDLAGAVVLGALALLLGRGGAPLPALLSCAFLLGAVGSLLTPSENAAIRSLVEPGLLPRALALLQVRAAVALTAGPLVGACLLTLDATWVFAVDAGTYLVAALCIALMRGGLRPDVPTSAGLRGVTDGIRFIWRSPFLRYAAVNSTVLNLVFNGLLVTIVASLADTGAEVIDVGTQTAAIGVGSLAGALIAAPAVARVDPARGIAGCTAAVAGALLLFSLSPGGWPSALFLACAAAAAPMITVLISATQMRLTPPELQGRVHSSVGFLAQTTSPLGPALAGFAVHAWGVPATVSVSAALVLTVAAAGLTATRRGTPGVDRPAPVAPVSPGKEASSERT